MRLFLIELVPPSAAPRLLLWQRAKDVVMAHGDLQRPVHPLVAGVLPRTARRGSFRLYPQFYQPHAQLRQREDARRNEGRAVVGADNVGQPAFQKAFSMQPRTNTVVSDVPGSQDSR